MTNERHRIEYTERIGWGFSGQFVCVESNYVNAKKPAVDRLTSSSSFFTFLTSFHSSCPNLYPSSEIPTKVHDSAKNKQDAEQNEAHECQRTRCPVAEFCCVGHVKVIAVAILPLIEIG